MKLIKYINFIIFVQLIVSTTSLMAKSKTSPHYQISLKEMTKTVKFLNKCSASTWPGLNWSEHKAVLVDKEKELATKFNLQNGTHVSISFDDTHKAFGSFDFKTIDGVKYVYIDTAFDIYYQRYLFLHEGFHFFQQSISDGWIKSSGRGVHYPVQAEPRILREHLYHYLYKFLQTNEEQYIQSAKHLFQKWKTKYPSDFNKSKDTSEGTAEYFSKLNSFGINQSICDLKKDTKIDALLSYDQFPRSLISEVQEDRAIDIEYYAIGRLASYILSFHKNSQWQEHVENQGEHILDVLFNAYTDKEATEISFIESIVSSIKDRVGLYNKRLEPLIEPFADLVEQKEGTIWISTDLLEGFNPIFLGSILNDMPIIIFSGDHIVTDKDKTQGILYKDKSVILTRLSGNPCDDQEDHHPLIAVIKESDTMFKDNKFHFNNNMYYGKLIGEIKKSKSGQKFFCAQPNQL